VDAHPWQTQVMVLGIPLLEHISLDGPRSSLIALL
jgi:hypothetical protein